MPITSLYGGPCILFNGVYASLIHLIKPRNGYGNNGESISLVKIDRFFGSCRDGLSKSDCERAVEPRAKSLGNVLRNSLSCRPLPLFVIGRNLDRFLRSRRRDGRQEKGTVVAAHAGMASHYLEEEQATHFIVPRSGSGPVYFSFAAIRAALQSNPTHNKPLNPLSVQKNVAQFL
jgi:hypothetical protein